MWKGVFKRIVQTRDMGEDMSGVSTRSAMPILPHTQATPTERPTSLKVSDASEKILQVKKEGKACRVGPHTPEQRVKPKKENTFTKGAIKADSELKQKQRAPR